MRRRLGASALAGSWVLVAGLAGLSGMVSCDVAQATPASAVTRAVGSDQPSKAEVEATIERVSTCFAGCRDTHAKETNEATCMLHCVQDHTDEISETHGERMGTCGGSCLEDFLDCFSPCDTLRPRTDRFTCELNCQGAAEMCMDGCIQPKSQ